VRRLCSFRLDHLSLEAVIFVERSDSSVPRACFSFPSGDLRFARLCFIKFSVNCRGTGLNEILRRKKLSERFACEKDISLTFGIGGGNISEVYSLTF
jgi:hypothetical protein